MGPFFFRFALMTNNSSLVKGIDYIINEEGNLVFTAHYLLKRGHCCQSGCLNCPYNYSDRIDPNVPAEFNDAWESFPESEEDDDDND